MTLRIIINAAPFRLSHADGALDQRALNSGRLWWDTNRSSCAGSSAPPAEIETPEDESECRESCDCGMGEHGFHGENLTGGRALLAIPALAPAESSGPNIAPGLPVEVGVDGGVGSTVVGVTEVAPGDDELVTEDGVTTGEEDDSGTEVVIEIVKLVGVALLSV